MKEVFGPILSEVKGIDQSKEIEENSGCKCSHTRAEKLECWKEIVAVRELCGGHWDICGDFKTVRTIAERRGCNRITNVMVAFSI
ncbi:hypothetical protein H5410_052854 [Solanum commersonii]|uniref:Uncharacterized protein n=1 Tax=Solanum commersonii TaxID=4109 RepID=A0A9J5X289_SOLCO|nr:hypothetical protein H5410_052854 [Solanum commersonii]